MTGGVLYFDRMNEGAAHLKVLVLFGLASAVFPAMILGQVATAMPIRDCPDRADIVRITTPITYREKSPDVSVVSQALYCLGYLQAPSGLNVMSDVTANALRRLYHDSRHDLHVYLKPGAVVFDDRSSDILLELIP